MIDPSTGLDTPDVSTTTPHQGLIGRLFSSYLAGSAGGGMTNGIGNAFANTNMGQDINMMHKGITGNTTPLIGLSPSGSSALQTPAMPSRADAIQAYKQGMQKDNSAATYKAPVLNYNDPYQQPYSPSYN